MMTTKHFYRATCTCGHKGRKVSDGNYATEMAENHASKFDPRQGGRSDGRRHHVDVEEVK